ncbi:MAG: hypothetical protein JST95_02800 [Bacteroidetes bacterium]|nr:hypothetical protein [Bacteroidota bacterium]
MKKYFLLILIGSSFFLQGCFDMIEQLTLQDNGTGSMQLVVNLSRSRTQLNSILKMKKVNGHRVPSKAEIQKSASDLKEKLENMDGLSDVNTQIDFNNFIATLDFKFSRISHVNAALQQLGAKLKDQNQGFREIYRYDPVSFSFLRVNNFALGVEYRKMSLADREIFSDATYTSIYRFNRNILSVQNPKSKISANGRAVMLKSSAIDLIKGRTKIDNQITLQK